MDAWSKISDSNLPPDKKIELSKPLLKQHIYEQDQEGELQGYIELARNYLSLENLQQANHYLMLARKLNNIVQSPTKEVRINNIQISFYAMDGNVKEATELMLSNLAKSELLDDELLLGDTLLEYAYIMQVDSEYEKAMQALFRAQLIFESFKDKGRVMSVQSYLAIIYVRLRNFHKAIEYYTHAVDFAKELGKDFDRSVFYYNIGSAYIGTEEWSKAVEYFTMARELSIQLEDKAGIAFATAQLGNVMVKNHQYQEALPLLLEAYSTSKNVVSRFMHLSILFNIAMSYASLDEPNLAMRYIEEAELIELSEDKRFPFVLMGNVYATLGDYETSSEIFLKHIKRLNADFEEKKKNNLQHLEVIYDVRFEKSRNELLQQENLLKQAELKEQNQYRIILLLILVLALVILGFTFRQSKIQQKHKQRFKDLAFKDELTHIANRRGILDFAGSAYQQAIDNNQPLVLAIIDLDHFKKVNDTYGHDVGDEVLRYFATVTSRFLTGEQRVGRYGGEEWLLVLPGVLREEIDAKFDMLFKRYQGSKKGKLPSGLMLSFSMGAVIVDPTKTSSVKALLKEADVALYKAKVGGRARCEIAE